MLIISDFRFFPFRNIIFFEISGSYAKGKNHSKPALTVGRRSRHGSNRANRACQLFSEEAFMDVFNSIDVRDLLSSPDVDDPSTPLSAPDLRLLIDRLQVRSLHIKSRVRDYVRSHHSEFSALFSQCSEVVSRSDKLSAELVALLGLISDNSVDGEIKTAVEEIVSKRKEAREKRELLEFIGIVLEYCERFSVVEQDIRTGKVVEAAESLRELKVALRLRDDDGAVAKDEEKELGVYRLLRNEWSECFEKLQEFLLKFLKKAVHFEPESNKLRVKYKFSMNDIVMVELQKVMKAMDAAGVLDYGLAKIADMMIKHVIFPAVSCRCTISLLDEVDEDTGHISESVLSIISSADPSSNTLDGEAIYSALTKVVEFIIKSLCFQSESWMHSFGRLTWPRMSDLIISSFLSKVIPDDASKFADFQKVVKLSSDFEVSLKELRFISSSDSKADRLSEFTDNVEVHFATRKKVEILAKARSMILQAGFSIPQEITTRARRLNNEEARETFSNNIVNLLFTSESCVVSDAALKLMELVHKTLKDVCLSSPRVALEFYHATRDAILLYEAVVPAKKGSWTPSIRLLF